MTEPWMDRKKLADHYSCSVRSIELAMADGLPYTIVFGRAKFRVSEVEPWLVDQGLMRRVDGGCTLNQSKNGAAPLERPAPGHEE